jgi:hypothetical protein
MARFMNDLNCDRVHIVKLYHYIKLKKMMYMVVKVEKQLKQKGTIR